MWNIKVGHQRCPVRYWDRRMIAYYCNGTMLECTKVDCPILIQEQPSDNHAPDNSKDEGVARQTHCSTPTPNRR